MAEFVMKKKVADAGIAERFEIASAGTSDEELGEPVYPGTRRILDRLGIDYSQKRARQITRGDYERYDLIIGMDAENIRNLKRLFPHDRGAKIHMLLDFTSSPRSISDPWYHDDFEKTYREVDEGCDALLRRLLQDSDSAKSTAP